MDCSALLNVQQQDFCRRLKIGNLLISPKNDLHSESCIFFEEAMETIHQQSLTETQQFFESNVLDIDEQDFLDLLIYRNVAIESFLSQFGDLVWLDNVDHNHSKFPLDHSSFRAKSNTSIKILLKHYYGDLENIKLLLSSQECETYHFVVFNLLLQEKNINQPQFRTIFLGFLPIKLISSFTYFIHSCMIYY